MSCNLLKSLYIIYNNISLRSSKTFANLVNNKNYKKLNSSPVSNLVKLRRQVLRFLIKKRIKNLTMNQKNQIII